MANEDLRVTIPKKFRRNLDRRYPDPATIPEGVNTYKAPPCRLCKAYCGCAGCPFERFGPAFSSRPCELWIMALVGLTWPFVSEDGSWDASERGHVLEWLRRLRAAATELITWE